MRLEFVMRNLIQSALRQLNDLMLRNIHLTKDHTNHNN